MISIWQSKASALTQYIDSTNYKSITTSRWFTLKVLRAGPPYPAPPPDWDFDRLDFILGVKQSIKNERWHEDGRRWGHRPDHYVDALGDARIWKAAKGSTLVWNIKTWQKTTNMPAAFDEALTPKSMMKEEVAALGLPNFAEKYLLERLDNIEDSVSR